MTACDSISSGFEPELPMNDSTIRNRQQSIDSDNDSLSRLNEQNEEELALVSNLPHHSYNPNGTNDLYTVVLIVNAALGAGLLNFPKAFDAAGGLVVAITVQLTLLVFIILALNILAYAADRNSSSPASTVEDVIGQSVGRLGRIITSLCVVVYCFGTTVTFLIMIGDQYDRLLTSMVGPDFCHKFYMNRDFTMTITGIVIILPFCFSSKIDFLRIPSMVGVAAILYLTGLIAYEYAYGGFVPGEIKHWPTEWSDVFLVIPDICFGYQCHVSAIPIYSCMKHRKLKHFAGASSAAIFICALAYTVSASLGYLTFGSNVNADILLSFPGDKPEVIIGIVAMALKTIFTYPILLYCGREAFNTAIKDAKELLGLRRPTTNAQEEPSKIQRVIIVLIWFALSVLCAIFVPNIGEAISFLGCLAAYFIFILPGLCLIGITIKSGMS